MPQISVLVPIYNVERYLAPCLDSLAAQSFEDFEVICINDGSTDGSRGIIQRYLDADPRFRVVDKPNSGYGASMNLGLSEARGRYVAILESDDLFVPRALELLHSAAEGCGAQVSKADFELYWSEGERHERCHVVPKGLAGRCVCPLDEGREVFYRQPSIWSGLYRRDFLEQNDIRFLETPGASYQDAGFGFKVWAAAERACFLSESVLLYRQDNEASSVRSPGKVFCVMDEYAEMRRWLAKRGEAQSILEPVLARMSLNSYLWNYARLGPELREGFLGRARAELTELREGGLFDACGMGPVKRAELDALIDHPERFARAWSGGEPAPGPLGMLVHLGRLGGLGLVLEVMAQKLAGRG